MLKLFENIDWPTANWLNQLAFYFIGCYLCFTALFAGTASLAVGFYFLVSTLALVMLSIVVVSVKGGARLPFAATVTFFNILLIPRAYFAYGMGMENSIGFGLVYVIAVIAMSSSGLGAMAMVCGAVFAIFQWRYLKPMELSLPQMASLGFLYIAAAAIAYCWRYLILRLYQILSLAMGKSPATVEEELNNLRAALNHTRNEERLLKEEMAIHIVEMKRMVEASGGGK